MSEPSSRAAAHEGLLARLGQVPFKGERSIWVLGHGQAEFAAASDLIEALIARYPRVDMLFTAPQPATRAWLRECFPRAVVLPPPLPFGFAAARSVLKFNVRGLLVLGAVAAADRAALRAANGRAVPAVVCEAGGATAAGATGPERIDHHFVTSAQSESRLRAAGIGDGRVTRLPVEGPERAAGFMAVMPDLLAQDMKLLRSRQRPIRRFVERLAVACVDHPRLRRLLAPKVRRIDDLAGLRVALGHPRTILCLGNGPSSEDPEVGRVAFDSLFRVNDLWLKRGLLTRPQMVFTGSKGALASVKGAIFGLHTMKSEARLLVAPLLRPLGWGFRYATIERFGLFINEPRWVAVRPTNGAIMLATAVALQPEQLVISGIDLFSHPAGTYPGDTSTPNAYTPGHNPDSELAILLEALSRYRGELVILSPALKERWEAFQAGTLQGQSTG
ncbi:MAG TPA: hypothetical protein VKP12_04980 [Kiloniellaceae bacterium]|nr:hypothetical protein [Kiloniellaceae bacterium]